MKLLKTTPAALCLAASALLLSNATLAQTAAPAAAASAAAGPEEIAKKADGQLAAAAWLSMLDQRNWGGAYEAAGQTFRNVVKIDQWMDSIPGLRKPFGIYQSRTVSDVVYKTSLPGRGEGEYVTVIFQTDFTEKKGLEELVTTVREADGRWRVIGYSPR